MNTRLNHVHNWLELAEQARWSASRMAKLCKVSVRTLERFYLKNMGATPKKWLTEVRQKQATKLLLTGLSIKETASQLGYKQAHHFSREFKGYWGCPPSAKDIQTGAVSCRISV